NPVTQNGVDDLDPVWSPDGSRIAFHQSNGQVFAVAVTGQDLTNVSNKTDPSQHPAWSKDGTMLAFDSNHAGTVSLFIVTRSGIPVVTVGSTGHPSEGQPDWAPDGTKIAFESGGAVDTGAGIWAVASTAGATPTPLKASMDSDEYAQPRWAPD